VQLIQLEVRDLRNIRTADLELAPGLNVFVGRNAQGKTSLLEAVGLLARGRSFRTEDTRTLIRRGSDAVLTRGRARLDRGEVALEVRLGQGGRRFFLEGAEVPPRAYLGQLDVVVYATDRLRVVRGPMRERRLFLDRSASILWPAYRQLAREYERVVQQRNAAIEAASRDLDAWDDRLIQLGARLRQRRAEYVAQLREAMTDGFHPRDETYGVEILPAGPLATEEAARAALASELEASRSQERRRRQTVAGPHRDVVRFLVNRQEAGSSASAGQARCLLLALTLAVLETHRRERGLSPVALLDDLDSELDDERARQLCRAVAARGQALVTSAHPSWVRRVADTSRTFEVADGRFARAS
jgi:DNA replication and repair protein RecF